MGLTSILRGIAAILMLIGVAMTGPLVLAISGGEASAGGYLFGAVASIIAGAGAFAASMGRTPPSDFRGALVIILAWWLLAPAFAAIPFAMEGLDFTDAYFEAVSAITTTGGWLSQAKALESPAGILWRAELQWLGGLASLVIAAAIFIRPQFIGIDTLLPPFSRGEKDSFLRPMRNAVFAFWPVYLFLTLIFFSVLAAAGAPVFDAVIMAMSTVASGGFIPSPHGVHDYGRPVVAALFPLIVVSGANFVMFARLLRGNAERVRDLETGAYLVILFCVGFLFWLTAGAGDVDLAIPQIFNAASLLSTNGYTIGEPPTLVVAMVTAIIGGAAVSTAGGFKILRWIVIMRRAREEIRRLIIPSGVFGERRVSNELGVWMHFIVFTMTLALLVVSLSIGGHDFHLATAAATSALSNTGPLIYLAEGTMEGYAVFEEPLRWLLMLGMVLGRLEAAVALALFNRAFWRA
jgi:trk system potassium uptake protein TrkH